MRKIAIGIVTGALTLGMVAAPAVIAKKGPKDVGGTVTVVPNPSVIEPATTTVEVEGTISTNSSCKKNRTVRFAYDDGTGPVALVETAVTKSNGKYEATLPKPVNVGPATVNLIATVDETVRKTKGSSKGKKKGHKKGKARKFTCLEISGQAALSVG